MKYRKTLEGQRNEERGYRRVWKNKERPKAENALGALGTVGRGQLGTSVLGLEAPGEW